MYEKEIKTQKVSKGYNWTNSQKNTNGPKHMERCSTTLIHIFNLIGTNPKS